MSQAGDALLAIDLGTSGVKLGLFDPAGNVLARASRTYALATPREGWAEQDPETWWLAVRECLAQMGSDALGRVAAACVVGQNPTLVVVDAAGGSVRPALTWGDRRATAEAAWLSERSGAPIDPSFNLPKALWLMRHETQSFARAATFLQSFDFINLRLSGERCSVSAVPPWGPWDAALIGAAELPRALFPERVCPLADVVGVISPLCASETGLPAGRPVVAGLVDGLAAWIGTATLDPGEMYMGSGTSAGANVCWGERLADPQQRVASLPHPLGRHFMVGGPMSTGSKFLDWLAREVCREDVAVLAEEAGSVSPGANGLRALPYLLGERTPIRDPHARAVFVGLSSAHGRAHLARAAMEAVALAIRDVTEVAVAAGAHVSVARTGGGGAASATWNQIKADVLGVPVLVPKVRDASLMGAAVVAAWGAGFEPDGATAARAMVHIEGRFEPISEHVERYAPLLDAYRRLYAALAPAFAALAAERGAA